MKDADFTGVILAGGKSSRFGSNKALAEFHSRRLIEHPAGALENIFTKRLLVTNTPDEYLFLGWPMTTDIHPGKGPLAGIHAALKTVSTPFIFVVGCDMPFPDISLIIHLCDQVPGFDAVIPATADGLEPLHGVYGRTGLPVIERCLKAEERKITAVLQLMNTRIIETAVTENIAGSRRPFKNINSPNDMNGI
ncbi:MAG: molybdenum cofactor guanylyltransferase [Proteobacteria bacterium]|nr:molybdenum cofactor guanylyltransferase [Pseudomonadota bacterium]MBU1737294.1 molybdenum cofactor guanylyltransferase [Pseudomonadota bacterium]